MSILLLPFLVYSQNKDDLFAHAKSQYLAGHLSVALNEINVLIADAKPNPQYFSLRAKIFDQQKNWAKALSDYSAAIKLDPSFAELYYLRAKVWLALHAPEETLRDLATLQDNSVFKETRQVFFVIDPSGVEQTKIGTLANFQCHIYSLKAKALLELEDSKAAEQNLLEAIRCDSSASSFHEWAVYLAEHRKDTVEAIRMLKAITKRSPEFQMAWFHLLIYDENIELPSDLQAGQMFGPTLQVLAVRAHEKEDFPKAVKLYNMALQSDDNALLRVNRGKALLQLSQFEAARQDFLRARQLDPTREDVLYLIGNAYFKQKNYEEAALFYEQYLTLYPENGTIHYNLANCWLALKEREKACESFDLAMANGQRVPASKYQNYCQ